MSDVETLMRTVITEAEARKITHGRTPLVPVEYEAACRALSQCCTLDEAKYWDNKADALAAWAKIYRNDDAGRKAAQLKLHAYRRMGLLAQELRPARGKKPGPLSLLKESGLTHDKATDARHLAGLPTEKFEALVNAPVVRSPSRAAWLSGPNESRLKWTTGGVLSACNFFKRNEAAEFAAQIPSADAAKYRREAVLMIEWLDEFERHLPGGP